MYQFMKFKKFWPLKNKKPDNCNLDGKAINVILPELQREVIDYPPKQSLETIDLTCRYV